MCPRRPLTKARRSRCIVGVRFHVRRGGVWAGAVLLAVVVLGEVGPAGARTRRPDAKARPTRAIPGDGHDAGGPATVPAHGPTSEEPSRPRPGRAVRGVKVTMNSANAELVLEGQAPGGPAEGGGDDGAGATPADAAIASGDAVAEVPLPLDEGRWEVMCAPPCGRRLPREALFRVTGAGVTTSASFFLPPDRSAITLEIDPGRSRWYWAGAIAAIAGGTFILGSVGPRLAMGGSFATVEKVMAGSGVVLVGAGLPLWWFNRTRVDIF